MNNGKGSKVDGAKRTKTIVINSSVTLAAQICQILLGFFIRKIFIGTLGMTYLGYNSVFSNILQMLNLADLGIGVAVTSYLYKPLAEKNRPRIAALMYLYKKMYQIIGLTVLIVGIVVSFFLKALIPDAECSIAYLRVLFYINLLGTVSTYFLAYKRTLLIADQKSYIANIVDTTVFFLISGLQIFILYFAPSYILYLIVLVVKNIISNIILSLRSDMDYGRLDKDAGPELVAEYRPQIMQYVRDVFISKIGAYVYYGTDNIIISIFKGSLRAGYLSNYTMITAQLNAVVTQVLSSVQATFGNFISSNEDLPSQRNMVDNYFCMNFFIGNFCMVCFMLLAQPFIGLVFGPSLALDFSTVVWMAVNLMLTILIQLPSQVFMIYKLYRYDKPIIVISAMLNIIISVGLVGSLGVDGVLIGTFVTSLFYLFSRFLIIAKKVFEFSYVAYVKKIGFYGMISFLSVLLTCLVCKNISGDTVVGFVWRTICVGIGAVCVPVLFLVHTKEFNYILDKFLPVKIRRFCSTKRLSAFGMALLVCIYLLNSLGGKT